MRELSIWIGFFVFAWVASCIYFYKMGYLRGGTAATIEVTKHFKSAAGL